MQQNLLEKWLNVIPRNSNIKDVFYIKWNRKKPTISYWTTKINKNTNFSIKIKWRETNKLITICGDIGDYDENNYYDALNKSIKKNYNIPIIKSHLQKAIRRQEHIIAMKSAWLMLRIDILAFLRRIMIIMIEDVYLHESFVICQWLLCAISSGLFRIQKKHIQWLLGLVHVLSTDNRKDRIDNKEYNEDVILKNLNENFIELSEYEYSILYSLYFRRSYGGMKSDKILIYNTAEKWFNRFIHKENYKINEKIKLISLESIGELDKEYWLLSGVDFHCCPYILEWIHKRHDVFTIEKIKSLIWNYSSKINSREISITNNEISIINDTEEEWNIIKRTVEEIQRNIIFNM